MTIRSTIGLAVVVAMLGQVAVRNGRAEAEPTDMDVAVADSLYLRASALLDENDPKNAKQLLIESLERSPNGPRSKSAREKIRVCNEKLGLSDLDHGDPTRTSLPPPPEDELVPADPYEGELAKPPDGGAVDDDLKREELLSQSRAPRYALTIWGGVAGFATGLAAGGPRDDDDNIRAAGVILSILGGAGGATGSYFLARRFPPTTGQAAVIASSGFWLGFNSVLFGDLVTGLDSSANSLYNYLAVGGLIGTGAGVLWAAKAEPDSGHIAMTNSLGMYGSLAGVLLAVALAPEESEAYSLQMMIGSMAGLTGGYVLGRYYEMSRKRSMWIDIGALGGAAVPWILIYPFTTDDSTNNDEQVAGSLAIATMAGGIVTAWLLTRGMDKSSDDSEEVGQSLIHRSGTVDGVSAFRPRRPSWVRQGSPGWV